MIRALFIRFAWLGLAALAVGGCQRTLISVATPTSAGGAATAVLERSAVLSAIEGRVEARTSSNGEWAPASRQQLLPEGSEVRTGPGARATILLTEGTKLYFAENSEFTFSLLNPHMDSLLTAIDLKTGLVWVLMEGGALDVETPFGIATARGAYLSVEYLADSRTVNVTCLEGVCGFGSVLVPAGYKLPDAADNNAPQPMSFEDYGVWGINVPESTQLAYLGTEAVFQGSATLPIVATATPSLTMPPTEAPTTAVPPTETASPADTATPLPLTPTPTAVPPTAVPPTAVPPSPEPTSPPPTAVPSPTLPAFQPTVTPRPFTPLPPAPIIGHHTVLGGETIFCIARGYGVLPAAISQANNLSTTANVRTGQRLAIPEVQWVNISAGPVCAPQFTSPFPGLSVATATSRATATSAAPPLAVSFANDCWGDNCGSREGSYTVRVVVIVSGGVEPYRYEPAQVYFVDFPHCTNGEGTVTVFSADGQMVTASWTHVDPSCQ